MHSIIQDLTNAVESQGEIIRDLQENMRYLRNSLDERLRENELKIEWALTDGTLAPKNTSSIMEKIDYLTFSLDELRGVNGMLGSCAEINGGLAHDVHPIYPNLSLSYKVLAMCDRRDGGGWTVIQKRFDGSVDFYRGWEDYVQGFGDPTGEHWLGLRHIHALTQAQPMELYVGVTDFDHGLRYAKYASFSVSSEEDKFRLHIGGYSGSVRDSLKYHNGQRFSTKDQDNDSASHSCASTSHHQGAWWYKACTASNLNGLFSNVKVQDIKNGISVHRHMYWDDGQSRRSLKASVMMIRPSSNN